MRACSASSAFPVPWSKTMVSCYRPASAHRGEPVRLERQLLRGGRPGEEIALGLVASELAELGELFRRLDAFGDRSQTEVAGQVDDGADDLLVPGVGSEP